MINTLKEKILEAYKTSSDLSEFTRTVSLELKNVIKSLAKRSGLKSRIDYSWSQCIKECKATTKMFTFSVKGKIIFNKHAYIEAKIQVLIINGSICLKMFLTLWLYNHKNNSFHPESSFDRMLIENLDFEEAVKKIENWKTSKVLPYLLATL